MQLASVPERLAGKIASWVTKQGPGFWSLAPNVFGEFVWIKDSRTAFIYALHRATARVRFVQVGSNVAGFGDPIAPFLDSGTWSGVMVEPVEHIYHKLVENHGHNPMLAFENVAVSHMSGEQKFYFIDDSTGSGPFWSTGLGSFSRDVILKHEDSIPHLRERIRTITVPCSTFSAICEKHQIDALDLIHIDTEGFDYEVLRQIDFDALHPKVVLFEHKHLTREDIKDALGLMAEKGYLTARTGDDFLCVRHTVIDETPVLHNAWKRIVASV